MGTAIIKTDTGDIRLSPELVKKYLVRGQGNVSDQETMLFISLCKHQKLNPWINEAYLIKYGNQSATIVTGKDVFTKRAFKNSNCDGWKAGITVYNKKTEEIIDREGTVYVKDIETLIGGWCEVFFKNKSQSLKQSALCDEYISLKKDGTPNKMWSEKPATMIRKVAIVQTLREAFPDDFQGCYLEEEMKTDTDALKPLIITNEMVTPNTIEAEVIEDENPKEISSPEAVFQKYTKEIYTLTTELNITQNDVSRWIEIKFKKSSLSELNVTELNVLIDYLKFRKHELEDCAYEGLTNKEAV
jgi:phage recombination protein Bet